MRRWTTLGCPRRRATKSPSSRTLTPRPREYSSHGGPILDESHIIETSIEVVVIARRDVEVPRHVPRKRTHGAWLLLQHPRAIDKANVVKDKRSTLLPRDERLPGFQFLSDSIEE